MVATRDITLDAQGFDKNSVMWYRASFNVPEKHEKLVLFFGEVDGASEVYVNGKKVMVELPASDMKKPVPAAIKPTSPGVPPAKPVREGMAKARQPFQVDITSVVKPGENLVALRVDHTKITDLALGGILRPVLLVNKPR
jgi:beta-galactosidase/beta-glucuronidase